ncbi:MAG: hypothetical protein Q9M92_02530 [Enterobacterales bacterium]|nr:hypothetical protein [Enterobacterales bacterium]
MFRQLTNQDEFKVSPVLKITSSEMLVPWRQDKVVSFDAAKLSFLVNEKQFSLKKFITLGNGEGSKKIIQ